MIVRFVAFLGLLAFTACTPTTTPVEAPVAAPAPSAQVSRGQAVANFNTAVRRMEPLSEAYCRDNTEGVNCDFKIQIHPDANAPPNAFQSLSPTGQPLLTFTQALIADARNVHEIAFVVGHEAAHHIAGHIPKQQQSAVAGAVAGVILAGVLGVDPNVAEQLARAGANVGARSYSKEHELEADALGTVLTHRAGFDPVRGAEFFNRIPDPGDRFLGTHPANAERVETVRRTAANL